MRFQISRLEQTWMVLRQRHTEGAILYEKKLKPFLKSLNEGKGKGRSSPSLPSACSFPLHPQPWRRGRVWELCPSPRQRQTLPRGCRTTPQGPFGLGCSFLPKEAFPN